MAPPPGPYISSRVEIRDEHETVGPDRIVESPVRIPHLLANESDGVPRDAYKKMIDI